MRPSQISQMFSDNKFDSIQDDLLKIELRRARGFTRPLIKLGFVGNFGDFVLCNKIDVTIGVTSAFIY